MQACPKCQASAPDGARECVKCGVPLAGANDRLKDAGWGELDLKQGHQAVLPTHSAPRSQTTLTGTNANPAIRLLDENGFGGGSKDVSTLEIEQVGGPNRIDRRKMATPVSKTLPSEPGEYPPAPKTSTASVGYFFKVRKLRAENVAAVRLIEKAQKSAEDALELALVSLGQAVLDSKENCPSELRGHVEAAQKAARAAKERLEARSTVQASADEIKEGLRQKIQSAQEDAAPQRSLENKLVAELTARQNDLKRAQARLQRAEIEVRNARAGGQAERVGAAETERSTRAADVAVNENQVRDLEIMLGQARQELALRLGTAAALQEELLALDKPAKSGAQAAERAVKSAELLAKHALRALGEAVIQGKYPHPLRESVERAMDDASRKNALLAQFRLIAESYDAVAYKKGRNLLIGGAFALIALPVVAIIAFV